MSSERGPAAQAAVLVGELGDRLTSLEESTISLLAMHGMLHTHPGVPAESLRPVDERLARLAGMVSDAVGMYVEGGQGDPVPSPPPRSAPDRHQVAMPESSRSITWPAATVNGPDRLVTPMAEVTSQPVSILIEGTERAVVNGKEVRLFKHDKAVLHALAITGGDMVTGDDLRIIANATVPDFSGNTKDMRFAVGGLGRRIERNLKYGIIIVSEVEGPNGDELRFGLTNAPGSSYESDIEPPAPATEVPRLIAQGVVEGSLYGGFIRQDSSSPKDPPVNPIELQVLADDTLYIRDGNRGRAVQIYGNNLLAANALLAIGGMANKAKVKALVQETGDIEKARIDNISTYVNSLNTLLGQSNGRDIVVRSGHGLKLTYGFNSDVVVVDRRNLGGTQPVFTSQPPAPPDVPVLPADTAPDAEPPLPEAEAAEEPGRLGTAYYEVVERYDGIKGADAMNQDELEAELAEQTPGIDAAMVRDMLVLHRLGKALEISFVPRGITTEVEFAQCKKDAFDLINGALPLVDFRNPRGKLSELNILALRLGLPPEISHLENLGVQLANSTVQYDRALNTVRGVGLSANRMKMVLMVEEASLEATYERALEKLRGYLIARR